MKKNHLLGILALIVLSVTGCTPIPQNPEEYRKAAMDSMFAEKESITVNSPYKAVIQSWKYHAEKCLHQSFKAITYMGNGGMQVAMIVYNPKLQIGKKRSVFTLQATDSSMMYYLGDKPPKDGQYVFVADAIRNDKSSTKIDVYHTTFGNGKLIDLIKGWALGQKGCTDLTK